MGEREACNSTVGGELREARNPIQVKPVGVIVRGYKPPMLPVGDARRIFEFDEKLRSEEVLVYIFPEYREALHGLRVGQYIWILWYAHLSPKTPPSLQVHPYGDQRLPRVGVFATRSPIRPNNIMLSLARITALVDCGVRVVGVDALDGSPVLDIKPYSYGLDSPESIPQRGGG